MNPSSNKVVIDGAHVVTMNPGKSEYTSGHVVLEGNRIAAVAEGPAPRDLEGARYIEGSGCLVTPGLVNTHHHLYQWTTRGHVVDGTLFEWLTALYPVWGCIDEDIVRTSATGALGWLARTGCTTSTDHHYVFPHDGGDLLGAEIDAANAVGLRFHPTRGSMDLGRTTSSRTSMRCSPRPSRPSTSTTTRRSTRCSGSGWHPARRSQPPAS
jgi:cytosine/adenosine deaminase-related metal-dependent hydrolase